jgi:hypothetical protein
MAYILRRPKPKIADISCTKTQFSPGDRVIVRVYRKIDKEEARKLIRSIKKFAGCDIEVLIYDALQGDIEIEQPRPIIQACSAG